VGGGFFVRHSFLPLSLAWDSFQQKNGAPDFLTFRKSILKYRERSGKTKEADPVIGCIILATPFFFPESQWIPVPENWSANIVQGKTYNTEEPVGASLWAKVQERIEGKPSFIENNVINSMVKERYGREYLIRPRLGQGAFRVLVTEAYSRRCAITGERTLPVLNASHIKPYAQEGPHAVNNGLLLREDIHTLFDRGYMTVTENYRVEVSKRIKEDYGNGQEYYHMHGKPLLVLPQNKLELPSKEYIQWHNENVYVS
jgi:putative restriction endonuclease